MTVNILHNGSFYMDQRNLPREFVDEAAAKAWLQSEYKWLSPEQLKEYDFQFPEVVPIELRLPKGVIADCGEEYLNNIFKFAKQIGYERQLQQQLDYFGTWCERDGVFVHLYSDFAPYSFLFTETDASGRRVGLQGGLIFHGSHDGGGNGQAPTFSVSLEPGYGWSVHT